MDISPIDSIFNTTAAPKKNHNTITLDVVALPHAQCSNSLTSDPVKIRDEFAYSQNVSASISEPTKQNPLVAVVGVGYVGAHLVEAFAKYYDVIACDLSERRLQEVHRQLKGLSITYTVNPADLNKASHILIAVPTSLTEDKQVDNTLLCHAINTIEEHAQPGATVVVESSVAVGTTRALMRYLMKSKNLLVGMSPERIDPGRATPTFTAIPKIVSGLCPASLQSISALYSPVFPNILPVSSPEVAEMTKLYENCQRVICASYANEMADSCISLGIDPYEVSAAAASKPFGYLPFRPGPGLGGHCIPVNPYYLLSNCDMPLLEHATALSWRRQSHVARRFVQELLEEREAKTSDASTDASRLRIVVVGIGFKRGQSLLSNSPGVTIIRTLVREFSVYVEFVDPLVTESDFNEVPRFDVENDWNAARLNTFDGVIVAIDQVGVELGVLAHLKDVKVEDYSGGMQELHTGEVVVRTPTIPELSLKRY
ncbi:hypothetical protein NX059_011026 [Plenodomus lindquistii]|nr:hypothetical protein NX059_011026 [Plenodomus lindquistii]